MGVCRGLLARRPALGQVHAGRPTVHVEGPRLAWTLAYKWSLTFITDNDHRVPVVCCGLSDALPRASPVGGGAGGVQYLPVDVKDSTRYCGAVVAVRECIIPLLAAEFERYRALSKSTSKPGRDDGRAGQADLPGSDVIWAPANAWVHQPADHGPFQRRSAAIPLSHVLYERRASGTLACTEMPVPQWPSRFAPPTALRLN